jgi:multiple sugar transport system permease protein
MTEQIFHDHDSDLVHKAKWLTKRVVIYGILIFWTIICLFPIYWTVTTSFKLAPDVMQGNMIPWVDFQPQWRGWRSLGLSPETIGVIALGSCATPISRSSF